ncbi:hypothetical protein BSKO_00795 [Bryopsis sp. KO-2023]|nr:hypothetical protein BSKO_00795 [Bryopsis sp. KO-2023]
MEHRVVPVEGEEQQTSGCSDAEQEDFVPSLVPSLSNSQVEFRPRSLTETSIREYQTPRLGPLQPLEDTANDGDGVPDVNWGAEGDGPGGEGEWNESGAHTQEKRRSLGWKRASEMVDVSDEEDEDLSGFRIQRRASSKVLGKRGKSMTETYTLFIAGKRFIVDPDSFGYYVWQNTAPFMALFSTYISPFLVAFTNWQVHKTGPIQYVAYAIDAFFLFDMLLASRVAYYNTAGDRLITSSWKIFKNYANSRLCFDLAMNLPLMEVVILTWPANAHIRFDVGLLVLLRLLRWEKIYKYLIGLNLNTGVSYFGITIIKLILLMTMVVHWSGCGLFFLAKLRDFSDDTWVGRFDPSLADADTHTQYITTVYWAMTTLTTVGYGDFAAVNVYERAFCMAIMLINLSLTAYILGNMTLILTKSDNITSQFRDTIAKVNRYFDVKSLPDQIRRAAISHMQLAYDVAEQKDEVLKHCPPFIQRQVLKHLYQDHLTDSYIFQGCEEAYLDKLVSCAEVDFFFPLALVLAEDDLSEAIYVIVSGTCSVVDQQGRCICVLREGMSFGEECIVCGISALWSIETRSHVKVLRIRQADFAEASMMFPHEARACARNVLSHIEDMASSNCHDVRLRTLAEQAETNMHRQRMDLITKLCYLAKMNSVAELRKLANIDKKLDPNSSDYDKRTPLHIAASCGSLDSVRFLIEEVHADPNVKDRFGNTPLRCAVTQGHDAIITHLMMHGAVLGLEDEGPLMCETVFKGNLPLLDRLLRAGANPNVFNFDRRTPLHICCADGLIPMVRSLTKYGADSLLKDRWGTTPMDEAERNSSHHVLQFLL